VWLVTPRTIPEAEGHAAVLAWRSGVDSEDTLALAVRYSLQLLKAQAPGKSVEVRVPPYGAVQVVEGPTHTRGTPPAVVEMEPMTWLKIAVGDRHFAEAVAAGEIRASGERSDLSAWLPIVSVP
jgi:hypothetical protein